MKSSRFFSRIKNNLKSRTRDNSVDDVGNNHRNNTTSVPLLFALCRQWAWNAIEFRCHTHPEEAGYHDDEGNTALHWVVFGKPPVSVVNALLTACPSIVRSCNRRGEFPLHVAAAYSASGPVLRALIERYPDGLGVPYRGLMALHLLCDAPSTEDEILAVLEQWEGVRTILYQNSSLSTSQIPWKLWWSHSRMEIHSMLARIQQTSIPIQYYIWHHRERLEEAPQDLQAFSNLDLTIQEFRNSSVWRKSVLLLQVIYKAVPIRSQEDPCHQILHAVASLVASKDSDYPPELLEFALWLYPEQRLEQDDLGQVPLHKLMSTPYRVLSDTLLRTFSSDSDAAIILDHNQRYPLTLALTVGRRSWNKGGISLLIVANPTPLVGMDIDDRLYPMILSKLKGNVDTIFRILKWKPELCSRCLIEKK